MVEEHQDDAAAYLDRAGGGRSARAHHLLAGRGVRQQRQQRRHA